MRPLKKYIKLLLMVNGLLFCLGGFIGFLMPAQVIGGNSVADEIISLNVADRPLGEVLKSLSIAANCQFSIDESWKDYPITASFDNEPLYMGLKLILRNINNAVIYGSDRIIKIIVYDNGATSGRAAGQSVSNNSPQVLLQQLSIPGEATAPQPEVEISEGNNGVDNSEQQLEETADSSAETNEAEADNTETSEGESDDASSELNTATSEVDGNDSGTEEENQQTEETELTSIIRDGLDIIRNSEPDL